jgi:UDP-glucose 4-epimerase
MQQGYEVLIVDNLSNSSIDVLDGIAEIVGRKPEYANIDCGHYVDLDNIFNTHPDITGVIHFAASKAVGESVEKPLLLKQESMHNQLMVPLQ